MHDHTPIDAASVPEPPAKLRDRPLNALRLPVTDAAKRLVADLTIEVDEHLSASNARKRKRRAADQATFETTVTAVLSDLMRQCLTDVSKGISLGRSNDWPPKRYRTPVHNKLLPRVLDAISQDALGYATQTKGQRGFEPGQAFLTSLAATPKLLSLVHAAGLSSDDFPADAPSEVIHLNGPKPLVGSASLIDYPETPEVARLRAEVVRVNNRLRKAELWVDEDEVGATDFPDLDARNLVRRFTQGDFRTGGRLWGGFWQDMKREHRRTALWIDGEEAVELDFGQAGARILYGMAGAEVPDADLYAVPGFEKHRDGVKKVMSAMSFAASRLTRMPADVKTAFAKAHTMTAVATAVEKFHQPIAHLFFTGSGHRAQRVESDIIVETLLRLVDLNITGLPIHDAVLVARSSAPAAGKVMLEVFREKAGVEGSISSTPADALAGLHFQGSTPANP